MWIGKRIKKDNNFSRVYTASNCFLERSLFLSFYFICLFLYSTFNPCIYILYSSWHFLFFFIIFILIFMSTFHVMTVLKRTLNIRYNIHIDELFFFYALTVFRLCTFLYLCIEEHDRFLILYPVYIYIYIYIKLFSQYLCL